MARVTQQVIAEKTGLSRATVSFVINGRTDIAIPAETRRRVLEAVRECGYVHPRALSRRKTGNVGFLLSPHIKLDELFYHRFLTGIQTELAGHNYFLIISNLGHSEDLPDVVRHGKVDGLVLMSEVETETVRQINEVVPVVLLNSSTQTRVVDTVMPDNAEGIRQVVQYLVKNGHQRIGFFALSSMHTHHLERKIAFNHIVEELGVQPVSYVAPLSGKTRITMDETTAFVREYLTQSIKRKEVPSAVVCPSDTYACLFLQIAPVLGLPVPQKLSVIGFDDTEVCTHVSPNLSSVNQAVEEMGQQAVRMLMERIGGSTLPPREVRLGVELQIRESVAPCHGRSNRKR